MAEDGGAYRFLSGAEMEPTAVLAAEPAARFVARARLASGGGEAEAVWGILIRVPASEEGPGAGEERGVETDDGRSFRAAVVGDGRPRGDAAAVLAAARYWELPPDYVRRLLADTGQEPG